MAGLALSSFNQQDLAFVLPALSIDGIIALDIFEGTMNKEKFIEFLREQVVS
jgi:hypothetical protein